MDLGGVVRLASAAHERNAETCPGSDVVTSSDAEITAARMILVTADTDAHDLGQRAVRRLRAG